MTKHLMAMQFLEAFSYKLIEKYSTNKRTFSSQTPAIFISKLLQLAAFSNPCSSRQFETEIHVQHSDSLDSYQNAKLNMQTKEI